MSDLRLLQITDPHLGASEAFSLAGIETARSFAQVVSVAAGHNPDITLFTGDVAAEESPAAYQIFDRIIAELPGRKLWLPGNHDELQLMHEHIHHARFEPVVVTEHWLLLCLNSAVPGRVGGELSLSEVQFVADTLEVHPDLHVAIFVHHPMLPLGCAWLDRQRINNADALFDIVAQYPQVRAIFSGHAHQESHQRHSAIDCYTAPSTCIQFATHSNDFAVSDEVPGYREIVLKADGTIDTCVRRLDAFDQAPDLAISGY